MKYNLYTDNAGGYHLAALNESGKCVYYLCDNDQQFVLNAWREIKAGGNPIDDCWEGGEENPQKCLEDIESFVAARNGGAELIEEWEK